MRLVIDTREPNAIIQYLNAVNNNHIQDNKSKKNKSATISIEVKPLDIGDYEIYYLDDDLIPSVIIERKSLADLESSIKDGRYKEQSFRLDKSATHNHNVIYLIEGNIQNYRNGNFRPTIYSTMFSLNYFKGFSVINSNNKIETGEIIYNFIQKLGKERGKPAYYNNIGLHKSQSKTDNDKDNDKDTDVVLQEDSKSENYLDTIKVSKKSFITRDNIFELMLMQIPGISSVSAKAIADRYLNMKGLLAILETNPDDFLNIRLSNGRKLNKNILNSIKDFLDFKSDL
tara:strand:+ start:33 stop:890 length:858 start_codon:yes stop_codon:yes gene_type:complete